MTAPTATLASIILEARQRADAVTPSPTNDFTTDTELLTYANKAYRQLLDLIISCGDSAIELLVTSTTLTTPYTLPADFYRLAGIDVPNDTATGTWLALKPFQWRQRNDFTDTSRPRYRLVNGLLKFSPSTAAPSSVRLWYVPYATDLSAVGSVTSYNGWDDYLVGSVAAAICVKEDRDPSPHLGLVQQAAARVQAMCGDLILTDPQTVAQVEYQYEDIYDLI